MNSKNKADLQRKLAMTSVPKPPAGLAERIKKQIPEDLGAGGTAILARAETRRATWSIGIAASFLIVVSSVYLVLRVVPRSGTLPASPAARTAAAPAKSAAVPPVDAVTATPAAAVAPTEQRRDEVPAAAGREPVRVAAATSNAAAAPISNDVPEAQVPVSATETETTKIAEATPAPMAPAAAAVTPAAAPAPIAPPPAAVANATIADSSISRAEATATARKAAAERAAAVDSVVGGVLRAGPNALANAPSAGAMTGRAAVARFGISVDPAAVESVRDAIERSERPASVDVAALVNYFAGPPEEAPDGVAVNIEGSPAPVSLTPLARVVRISIDTPLTAAGVPSKAVATNVRLSISFNDAVVASHRLIGGKDVATGFEPALLDNTSVTALYDVQLLPDAASRRSVATATLKYRDAGGRERTLVRSLRVKDIARPWVDASRRHRLACLVAIWGATLEHDSGGADVARRAEELARQEPRDSKARELARLATASSRLRSSGSTGSGR